MLEVICISLLKIEETGIANKANRKWLWDISVSEQMAAGQECMLLKQVLGIYWAKKLGRFQNQRKRWDTVLERRVLLSKKQQLCVMVCSRISLHTEYCSCLIWLSAAFHLFSGRCGLTSCSRQLTDSRDGLFPDCRYAHRNDTEMGAVRVFTD